MVVQNRLYTADDLWEASHRPGETRRLEVVKGALRERTPTGGLHGVIALEIGYQILHHAKQHQLGYATSAETGFILAAGLGDLPGVENGRCVYAGRGAGD